MRLNTTHKKAFVNAVMADVPQVDYNDQIRQYVFIAARQLMPDSIRTIWDDKDLRGWLRMDNTIMGGVSVVYPAQKAGPRLDRNTAVDDHIRRLAALNEEQHQRRQRLQAHLEASIVNIRTSDALKTAFPEFEKYIPAEEASSRNLPALANLVSEFVQAGWPKDRKPAVAGYTPRKKHQITV